MGVPERDKRGNYFRWDSKECLSVIHIDATPSERLHDLSISITDSSSVSKKVKLAIPAAPALPSQNPMISASSAIPASLQLETVCVSITGATAAVMQANALAALAASQFLELRLDYLTQTADGPGCLASLHRQHPGLTLLATCRPERSGGRLPGSAHEELQILLAAADAGAAVVDLSLESAEDLGSEAVQALRSRGAAVLISFHDFHATGDLNVVLSRICRFEPDFAKIVPTAHSLHESLAVLRLLRHAASMSPSQPLVALAMGEQGLISRVLGPSFGSAFTFAAASAAEATAPGQLTAETLKHLYRIGQITLATRLFGVAGDPIHSSLSPLMLNQAFRDSGMDAAYLPLKTSDPAELFFLARDLPLQGFSVTMPLKQTILPLLDHIDPLAARIGAVNTVRRTPGGRFEGFNTDAAGIVLPLEQRRPLQGARVLVLGAGGAARAAVFGCADRGASVFIHNRTAETAVSLAAEAGASALPREALQSEHFDVLINTTPAGMRGNALTLPLAEDELHADLVFDLVYNPLETPLLTLAREKGLEVIQGVEMFIHQGARQFQLWTGKPAPVQTMQAVVLEALHRRA